MGEIFYLYCHTNLINNKKYFGITSRIPEKRWGHCGCNYTSSPYFYNAIKKYGWDNFEHAVITVVDDKDIVEMLEREYIMEFRTYDADFGYNIELGGNYKGKHSESTKRKISMSKIGKPRSEETKRKVSNGLMGKMVGKHNARSKPVICITTGLIYESQGIASKETGVQQSDISRCCRGKLKSAGVSKIGEKLVWRYYSTNTEE